jgi:bacterioferritin-associated ferredoxin
MHDSESTRIGEPGNCRRLVCPCRQVTEAEVVRAITALGLCTLKEIGLHTGAGDGCTCCHKHLLKYLEQPEPAELISSIENVS